MDDIVNLSLEPLVISTNSTCVTIDGKGIENLFSMNRLTRGKGMHTERFIRPPVSLTIMFKIPLCITHVLIRTQLDANDICKIGLSANGTSTENTSVRSRDFCGIIKVTSSSRPHILYNKLYYNTTTESVVPNQVNGSLVHAGLVGHHQDLLQPIRVVAGVRSCTINFIYWSGPKPLSIQTLEIWGKIDNRKATYNEKLIYDHFVQSLITTEATTVTNNDPITTTLYNTYEVGKKEKKGEKEESINKVDSILDNDDIPLEYIDSLTCDIMTIPVQLPSGHCVDQSTVDKASELDILCGRSPSDPFTGVPYSNPPKFCSKLKADIDKYLTTTTVATTSTGTASTMLTNKGRTLGSAYDIIQHQTRLQRKTLSWQPLVNSEEQEQMQPTAKKRKEYSTDIDDSESGHRKEKTTDHETMLKASLDNALNSLYP